MTYSNSIHDHLYSRMESIVTALGIKLRTDRASIHIVVNRFSAGTWIKASFLTHSHFGTGSTTEVCRQYQPDYEITEEDVKSMVDEFYHAAVANKEHFYN